MRFPSRLVFCCTLVAGFLPSAFGQKVKLNPPRAQHSFNVHYGFSYAADVSLDQDRQQRLPGIGYQYTNEKSWYMGIDLQYDKNKIANYALPQLGPDPFYTYRSRQLPTGIGYFTKLSYTPPTFIILTSDSIFRTPLNQYPVLTNLYTQRFNLFFHYGKRWVKKRSQLEAGLTFQGTYFKSVEATTDAKFLPIITYDTTTGFGFLYTDGVRYAEKLQRSRFVPGAGLHLRYNYQFNQHWGLGLQAMLTASAEGLYAQLAPRLVYSITGK